MNTSQLPLLFRRPLTTALTLSTQFLQHRSLPAAMVLLQLAWLALIAGTGASTRYGLILALAVYSTAAALLVIFAPVDIVLRLREFGKRLLQSEKRPLVLLFPAAIFTGLLYANSQHVWGDEGESFRVANIVSSSELVVAYMKSGWLINHPPLMPLIYASVIHLFGAELVYLRLVSALFLGGMLVVTYFLGLELYGREVGFLAAILLFSFPLVIRLGASAMLDIQLAFFFCLALLLLVRLARKPSFRLAGAAGVVMGLGLLTKYIMVFVFGVLFLYILFINAFRTVKFHLLVAFAVSLAVFAGWLAYANHIGLLPRQIQRILNLSGSYHALSSIMEDAQPAQPESQEGSVVDQGAQMQEGIFRLGLEAVFTRLPSALGVHYMPLIMLAILYLFEEKNPSSLAILLWIGAVSISLLLTLPDHRYFLPVFPAIAIAVARVLHRFPACAERTILLGLLFEAGNLYLFADWIRESHLFLPAP